MIVKRVMAGEAATEAVELRYLRLYLGSRWSPTALAEAAALSTDAAPGADAGFDWAAVRQYAWDEGVALLWYSRVRGRNLVPAAIEAELQAAYRENALRNTALFGERDRILRELGDAGSDVIVLKGAALAEAVYGDIALRPMSDLDLLVRPRDVSAVLQRLAHAGYVTPAELEPHGGPRLEDESELVVYRPGDRRYHLDLHWNLFASPYYQRKAPADWFWATAIPLACAAAGASARMLGPEAQVLHLAAHLMLHHRGQGLMWWQDVGEVVQTYRRQIDWDVLCERACAYDLVLPLQRVVLDLVDRWRLPIPDAAIEQLCRLEPSSREREVYGWLTVGRWPALKRFQVDLVGVPGWRGRLRYIWRGVFPSPTWMRWRYGLRQAWQVPLAYPYRWLRGLRPE